MGEGDKVVHLDLHPLNVIIGPKGPVVIDWTGASRFLARFDRAGVASHLREVVTWKVRDPNMSPQENAEMWRLVERAERLRG